MCVRARRVSGFYENATFKFKYHIIYLRSPRVYEIKFRRGVLFLNFKMTRPTNFSIVYIIIVFIPLQRVFEKRTGRR